MKHVKRQPDVIEPEILDERGNVISRPEEKARPKGDAGGFFGGLFVLAFGFLVTLLVGVFTVCVVLPLMLVARVLGLQVHTFKR